MKTLLPHLFELSKGAMEALQAADLALAPLELREDERGSIEVGLARVHLRRAIPPLVEALIRLSRVTGTGMVAVEAETRH
jgi:hypothetical protein